MIFSILTGMALVVVLIWAYREQALPETLFTLLLLGGVVSCNQSEWYQKGQREERAQEAVQARADAQPRVIREVDGCKVYTFKAGDKWHYFTRCKDATTTEAHYDEKRGKSTVDVSETVRTVNER